MFQKYALFPHLNVAENIGFGLNLKKVDKTVIAQKVERMLKMVGLEGFGKRDVTLLSGGQQQRVAIARALVNEPKVLLLDEPLGALDAKIRKQMQVELKKIQQEVGITFIYVTHDQEEALSMSDTVVVMNNGEIQQIGSPTDIYNEPENRFVAGFIGESNIIEGTMIRDYLVAFDGFEFECVDKGFEDNEEIEVVLRPEDLDIVDPGQAKIRGIVRNITFKGVHYEILIETELRTYMVHTTDYAEVGREVGLKFGPEDIHVMYDSERDSFMIALKALGYSMNTTNEAEIEEAYQWLIDQRDTMDPIYAGDDVIDNMISGNKALAVVYSGDASYIISENPNLDYFTPEQGTNRWYDAMVITKDCSEVQLAHEFIDFMISDKSALSNTEEVGYTSTVKSAFETMKEGDYAGISSYIPDTTNPNNEIFAYQQPKIKQKFAELWTKVKAK